MGIVNVTPDSFSDGGSWIAADKAVDHGRLLAAEGADIVDIGGESTRPGAIRPSVVEELDRVLPVVSALHGAGTLVSIDTMRAEVARAAVEAGAAVVNDVSGGLADPEMLSTVAELGVAYVAMHWRGHSTQMQSLAVYDDVVTDVASELLARVEAIDAAGIELSRVALDPGIGFAKTNEHNWALLNRLGALQELGFPLVVGTSRKAFLGALLADEAGPRPATDREDATTATTALAAAAGAWCVRVHEARPSRDAIAVAARWVAGDAS